MQAGGMTEGMCVAARPNDIIVLIALLKLCRGNCRQFSGHGALQFGAKYM